MFNLLYAEVLKFRNSRILWLIPAGGIIPVLLIFINWANNPITFYKTSWQIYAGSCQLSVSELLPPLVFLLAGFVFTREYLDNTIYTMLTYPITRFKILVSKTLVLLPVLFSIILLTSILSLTLGLFFRHNPITSDQLYMQLKVYLIVFLLQAALLPAAITLSILSRSIIAPAAGGVCGMIAMLGFLNTKFNIYFPWCIPALITNKISTYERLWDIDVSIAIRVLIIAFLLPAIFNVVYYCKSDV